MRLARFLTLVVLILGLSVASAHASVILTLNGSILTGAKGVDVGGTLYDVEFVEGTCAALFDGCDSVSDFTFTTLADATVASQALLDQVFLDGVQGNFDTVPTLTFGCSDGSSPCEALTPYGFFFVDFFLESQSQNAKLEPGDLANFGASLSLNYNSGVDDTHGVFARWTPAADAAPVPEPASLTLLGLGLAGMAGRRWRQRKA